MEEALKVKVGGCLRGKARAQVKIDLGMSDNRQEQFVRKIYAIRLRLAGQPHFLLKSTGGELVKKKKIQFVEVICRAAFERDTGQNLG